MEWRRVTLKGVTLEVSNTGQVRTIDRQVKYKDGRVYTYKSKPLKLYKDYAGYLFTVNNIKVHRLVAMAFLPNPNNLPVVNHKDFNRSNNNIENLEWCSHYDNIHHALKKPNRRKCGRKVLCVETDEVFDSITLAARMANKSIGAIFNALNGISKTAGGYSWKYI